MSCPYVIRETIDADHVREHGYYQLDEMVYDLTHDFANADVEVIARHAYNVVMESGESLSDVDDETVFKMLSAGLPVKYVENARDGYIMYSRPESKPAVKAQKVSSITRADKPITPWCHQAEANQQYVDAIGPSVTPENWNFTAVVLYDYEQVWVGRFHGENAVFNFLSNVLKTNARLCFTKATALSVGHSTVLKKCNSKKGAAQR